ncbi:hypothetical protein ABZT17_10530 [Streptomyces sp. NPDC005648]|uniref:hypothetical protein n=1 Tax=Streptomyces sp. NPDC005648 TaxID=3157044 RepID=UPI0033BA6DD0
MDRSRSQTYGRLLLFAVLLLGVLTMHTLGHPSEEGGGAPSPVAVHLQVGTAHGTSAGSPAMDGMDPSSVCLAVLGTFTLGLLLAAALTGGATTVVRPVRPALLLRALWPNPPPPGLLLSRLSVLRI